MARPFCIKIRAAPLWKAQPGPFSALED